MKSFKNMRRLLNDRGIAVILVAGILVTFLLLFMVVGIEFARMYYVRGQLQNAADSAALAGAQKIKNSSDTTQTPARDAAQAFAADNTAAGLAVHLASTGQNTTWPENPNNDIAVGRWSETAKACSSTGEIAKFCPGVTPVNAVKVVAQRANGLETANASTYRGPVDFLFKGIGSLVGWTKMDIRRQAIASNPSSADIYMAVCWKENSTGNVGMCQPEGGTSTCFSPNTCSFSPVRFLLNSTTSTCDPVRMCTDSMAWSSLQNNTSTSDVGSLLCAQQPVEQLCGKDITTSGGTESGSFSRLEALMYNPAYDGGNKTCGPVGGPFTPDSCGSSSSSVNGWWVEVPILNVCPPTNQPTPIPVVGYAKLHIVAACGSSASVSPCASYSAPTSPVDACNDYYGDQYKAKYGSNGSNYLAVDAIQCVTCDDDDGGYKAVLKK